MPTTSLWRAIVFSSSWTSMMDRGELLGPEVIWNILRIPKMLQWEKANYFPTFSPQLILFMIEGKVQRKTKKKTEAIVSRNFYCENRSFWWTKIYRCETHIQFVQSGPLKDWAKITLSVSGILLIISFNDKTTHFWGRKRFEHQVGFRLHSHDVKYGSGSGQQSVTAVKNSDDINSHWQIFPGKTEEKECA